MEAEAKRTKLSVNSVSLPSDLIMEIIKRLPVKTLISKFLMLSKQWYSIIRSPYFKKLYVDASLTRPKSLVFTLRYKLDPHHRRREPLFEVLKTTRKASSSSSSSASLDTYYVTCFVLSRTTIAPSVHGLICYGPVSRLVIYNPFTRRSINLPFLDAERRLQSQINHYIGYDPIDNDYKVICITKGMSKLSKIKRCLAEKMYVLTLGETAWRVYQNRIPPHSPESQELCINGVLYYRAFTGAKLNDSAIMSFDVRSEKLDLIKGPCTNFPHVSTSRLTSYEGKLAVIFHRRLKVNLWVMQNNYWSKKSFLLPPDLPEWVMTQFMLKFRWFTTTDTDTGEIILVPYVDASPSAFYFDVKKNTTTSFQEEEDTKSALVDYCHAESVCCQVENLMFL